MVMKSCLRFRFPLCHGESLLDQRCSTKKHEQYLHTVGCAGLCLSLPLCRMQSARYGAYASAGFTKHVDTIFIKPSHLEYCPVLIRWVSHSDDDGRNQCAKMPIKWWSLSVYGHHAVVFAIDHLFLDQSEMAMIFCLQAIFLAAVLSIIMVCIPLFTEVFDHDNLNNSIQRKHHQYAGGEVLR